VATVVNRLKGTLKLGDVTTGKALEAQVTKVGVPQTVTRDSPVTVLTGDVVTAAATYSWALTGEALLDMSVPAGIYYFVRQNQGAQLPFTFNPVGTPNGPTITGTVIVDGWSTEELAAGANVISKFNWPIQGQITVTPGTLSAEDADAEAEA
jgi:hypothetical protein